MTRDEKPNVRLRTNVLCTGGFDAVSHLTWHVDELDIRRRLTYWELRAYARANPMKFPFDKNDLTREQEVERDAYIEEGRDHPWPGDLSFRSMPLRGAENPFLQRAPESEGSSLPMGRETREAPVESEQPVVPPAAVAPSPGADPQRYLISAPVGRSHVVIAPPGTGKTHAVVTRIIHLITQGLVDNPAQQVRVLSFSRAAVAEIMRRVADAVGSGGQDDLRYVGVSTFDAFAWQQLTRELPPGTPLGRTYADNIRMFTRELSAGRLPEAADRLGHVRELIIDEVQDLNGVRAEMVLELMRRVTQGGGGVLLLGDPAQAIFEFDLDSGDMTAAEFLKKARRLLDPTEVRFTDYHRFDPSMRDLIVAARDAIGEDGLETDGASLLKVLRGIGSPSQFGELAEVLRDGVGTAVLTRRNNDAFQIAKWLASQGIPARIHRGARAGLWPGWLARLTLGYHGSRMGRDFAALRWDRYVAPCEVQFHEAWDFLSAQGLLVDNALDVQSLASVVARRGPIQPASPGGGVVVSTIHRSKGLEFDRVFLLNPGWRAQGDAEEARIVYVAATRARRHLHLLRHDYEIIKTFKNKWGHTYFSHYVKRKDDDIWIYLDGIEEFDVHGQLADVTAHGDPTDMLQRQSDLWAVCRQGTYLRIVADGMRHWLATDSGSLLGPLTPDFSRDLRLIGKLAGKVVGSIGAVDVVETASESLGNVPHAEDSLGTACLAIVPVVSGPVAIRLE